MLQEEIRNIDTICEKHGITPDTLIDVYEHYVSETLKILEQSEGAELIKQERWEQRYKHGWDIEHDSAYKDEQLVDAAFFCLDPITALTKWPTGWSKNFKEKIINKDRIGQLKVAGAFCAAEIDRLQHEQETANRVSNENVV